MSYRQKKEEKNIRNLLFFIENMLKISKNRYRIWSSIPDTFWHLFWTILGASGDPFGRLGRAFGRPWALIGVSFALSWRILEPCWSLLAILWAILSLQGSFWSPPSMILEPLGTNFGCQMDRESIVCQGHPTSRIKHLHKIANCVYVYLYLCIV